MNLVLSGHTKRLLFYEFIANLKTRIEVMNSNINVIAAQILQLWGFEELVLYLRLLLQFITSN